MVNQEPRREKAILEGLKAYLEFSLVDGCGSRLPLEVEVDSTEIMKAIIGASIDRLETPQIVKAVEDLSIRIIVSF